MKFRVVTLSDTHGFQKEIEMPKGDILVHSGDITDCGEEWQVRQFLEWLNDLPYERKIFCNGNHEVQIAKMGIMKQLVRENCNKSVVYLENEAYEYKGLKFWGSPYSLEFFPEHWGYQLKRQHAKALWDMIPEDTDILLTHSPPKGIMDGVKPFGIYTEDHAGCNFLLEQTRKINPYLHVFGHIHRWFGTVQRANPAYKTLYVNASMCDDSYKITRKPIVIDIDTELKTATVVPYE